VVARGYNRQFPSTLFRPKVPIYIQGSELVISSRPRASCAIPGLLLPRFSAWREQLLLRCSTVSLLPQSCIQTVTPLLVSRRYLSVVNARLEPDCRWLPRDCIIPRSPPACRNLLQLTPLERVVPEPFDLPNDAPSQWPDAHLATVTSSVRVL